ncbi:hypothetical protein EVAR_58943_1 [Eumeta japonica]|uniref:Uncharacterized protein n=1 Tax=Eumeta variegata TaxID=151549 RepID=A0A4C1YJW1_EUMVA|nr:hypothetical protein EVAR_58943_1 [Eumeta japonica]
MSCIRNCALEGEDHSETENCRGRYSTTMNRCSECSWRSCAIVVMNRVFNGILRTGQFLEAWKRGKIITITNAFGKLLSRWKGPSKSGEHSAYHLAVSHG